MRLIDADVLISFMRKGWRLFPSSELRHTCDITDVESAPTIDAVEVVRCKDCKKYVPCQKLPIGTSKWCDMFDRATCEMNYCGWGERREDEEIG